MRRLLLIAGLAVALCVTGLRAQVTRDVIGVHNLGPGGQNPITGQNSPTSGQMPGACAYCHAPHNGLTIGLWNQKLTTQTYTTYTSTSSSTEANNGRQPAPGRSSNQCLSCHDGTVAAGTTIVYGTQSMKSPMASSDLFGSNLQTSHPFSLSLPLKDNIDLVASLKTTGKTADATGAVKLINGNVECASCHDPHVQTKDNVSVNFLVMNSSGGALCLACHDPTRQMTGLVNPLADWATSAHALSGDTIATSANLGSYPTVATSACISCHAPHNAGVTARLLRGKDELDCLNCHKSGTAITNGFKQYVDIASEYASGKVGHPFPAGTNLHDANENVLLNVNRHATCVDCHNAHGSELVGTFTDPPLIRVSQKNVPGISATDGVTVLTPAINQFENCLRCHGTSSGKASLAMYGYLPSRAVSAGDPLNLIPQFDINSTSSHPVTHTSNSRYLQPSLLTAMMKRDGTTAGRPMGTQILCTDCHNSDDNRESGGQGPNGPHGSIFTHILERRYEFSQAAQTGQTIGNLFPTPDLTVSGPYGLCEKCHDLANQIMKNTSWNQHSSHINAGFSCSVCHTAHGMGATSGSISGERLVNFDVNVVASNGGQAISYNRAANSCVLVCHGAAHNTDGSVTMSSVRKGIIVRK